MIEVQAPSGSFTPDLDVPGHHVLIAAGSGITPVLSIAASVLAAQDKSSVTLLYGNRRNDSVMFADEIADLKDAYPERICLVHVLSREPQEVELFNGRLDAAQAARAAAGHRRRGRGGPLVAVRPVRPGGRRDRPARRARRAAAADPPRAVLRRGRPARPGHPRRGGRGPGRRGDRAARRPQQHRHRPARHPGAGRRPAGPPGPAVRVQGRGVRHLPRPAHRRTRSPCAATTPWSRRSSTRATF